MRLEGSCHCGAVRFARDSASRLPVPPEHTHLMLAFKAPWVEVEAKPGDKLFDGYPDESLAAWHQRQRLPTG